MFKLSLFFSYFLCCFLLSAQYNHDIRYYGEESGFYDTDDITDIQVDAEGNIWLLSFSGITRYDGHEFKEIKVDNVNHSSFYRFYLDHKNRPLVVDATGGVFYIQKDTISEYKNNRALRSKIRGSNMSDIIFDNDGRLFISTYKPGVGICVIEKDSIYNFKFRDLAENGDISILDARHPTTMVYRKSDDQTHFNYIANLKGQILDSIKSNKQIKTASFRPDCIILKDSNYLISNGFENLYLTDESQFRASFNYPNITRLLTDSNGYVYISTYNDGIHVYKNTEFNQEPYMKLFPNEFAFASAIDKDDGLWFYNASNGLGRMQLRFESLIYNDSSELNFLKVIEGVLYFNSSKNRIDLIEFNTLKRDELNFPIERNSFFNNFFYDMISDSTNNILWFSSNGKVYFINEEGRGSLNINSLNYNEKRAGGRIKFGQKLVNDQSQLFAYKRNWLYKINESFEIKSYDLPAVINSVQSYDSISWIATEIGLFTLKDCDTIIQYDSESPILNKNISQLVIFQNKLFFVVDNEGVYYIDNGEVIEIKYRDYRIPKADIIIKDNELWLFSSMASFLIQDSKKIETLKAYRPLIPKGIKFYSSFQDKLFFSNARGEIYFIEFDDIKSRKVKEIDFKIDRITANGSNVKPIDSLISLDYFQNNLRIYCKSISFEKLKIEFRYRIKGLSDIWEESNERNFLFPNLMPGDYCFELQARIGNQPWSSSKIIRFHIDKPFWQEIWFIFSILIGFGILIYFFIKNRLKTNRKEHELAIANLKAEQRALRAQMNPHFIFNVISSAQYFILKKDTDKANQFLNMFSRLLRSSLKQAGMNMISIKQEVLFIEKYLELEQFRLEGKFQFSIDTSQVKDYMEQRIPQFMLQPFVENAIQHGIKDKESDGIIKITFAIEGIFFRISIEDNGPGINYTKKLKEKFESDRESFGISITEERLKLYNENEESLEIKDISIKNKTGTKVILYLKRKTI